MNKDIAISVRNISKAYTIRHNAEQHTMLSEAIMHTLRNPLRRQEKETFWALKDINFDVKKGDVVGIIGRNGAGKSTLLKILSRITEPTTGEILMDGRVGSLLEVGTGFHPELTGRENIYLNGAILGMKRREIDKKFDEIVDFAGVEQFLDTPVKRYSSGMYVRLAFAVAAHLNPEILIVDEVLSVGDAEFQKKCLGKMGEVAKSGRTVLFVSHNMGAIKNLCHSCIVICSGNIIANDYTNNAIRMYRGDTSNTIEYKNNNAMSKPYIRYAKIIQEGTEICDKFVSNNPISIYVEIDYNNVDNVACGIIIYNSEGICLIHTSDEYGNYANNYDLAKHICIIPNDTLNEDQYYISLWLGKRNIETYETLEYILKFTILLQDNMSTWTCGKDWKGLFSPAIIKWE